MDNSRARDINPNGEIEDSELFIFARNHLGSVMALVDSTGKIAQRYVYSAYGKTKVLKTHEGAAFIKNPYAYTSRELDEETGDYYYRARYYNPSTGRFLSEDPIGFRGGDTNLYRYVKNNPIRYTDPSGTNPWAVVGEILLGIFGLDYDDAATGNAGGCPLNGNENREIDQMTKEENLKRLLNGKELPPVNVTPGDLITPINPNIPGIVPGPA